MAEQRRYVTLPSDPGEKPRRALVQRVGDLEGVTLRTTTGCPECAEGQERGPGCRSCGYTGRRRWELFYELHEIGVAA